MAAATKQTRRWSWRVATIDGIDVRLHASLLLLVWLLLFVAVEEPGEAMRTAGFLTALFVCVLVHEFAHCFVARHNGIGVVEIELLPLGGVSKMDRLPDDPARELAIAVAGPLTSLALGCVLLMGAAVAGFSVWPPALDNGNLVQAVGWANVLLAGFNLLPALPLDGGRILRAVVERRTGPMEATKIAARWGRDIAIGMIVFGVLVNIWLLFIGVFVFLASNAEEAAAIVHQRLAGLTVRDLMIRDPVVVNAHATVGRLEAVLPTTVQRQFPVVSDAGDYVGMIDVTRTWSADPDVVLGDIADRVPAVPADQPAEDELDLLRRGGRSALAVVEGRSVIGIIRGEDLARVANRALSGSGSRRGRDPRRTGSGSGTEAARQVRDDR